MASISKTFNSIKRQDLINLFDQDKQIIKVTVGRKLEVALGVFDEFNLKAQTLFEYPFNWSEGNTITLEFTRHLPTKTYRTVNLEPEEYAEVTKAQVELVKALARKVTIKETVTAAVKLLTQSIKDGNYGADKEV